MHSTTETAQTTDQKLSEWFDKLSFDVHIQKTRHESGTMDERMKQLYTELMNGEMKMMAELTQNIHTDYFKKKITLDFLNYLAESEAQPLKLAINYNKNSVLVWSVIDDNDDKSEDALILLQAKINQEFEASGFRVNATIVERSDNFPVPPHYRELRITA